MASLLPRVFDLPLTALEARLRESFGLPSFHARAIWRAALSQGVTSFSGITGLKVASRASLTSALHLRTGASVRERLESSDGTRKFLLQLPREDPAQAPLSVESVLIPHARGRVTLCVSSQAGCALACSFCSTGAQGFTANLSPADIVEQVLLCGEQRAPTNVVFMGQGEPLLNLKAVAAAVGVLTSPHGLALPPRRVTISTSGIAPAIPRVATQCPGVRLALSLHAPEDALRSRLMGINNQYPLPAVFAALKEFVALRLRSSASEEDSEGEEGEGGEGGPGRGGGTPPIPPGQRYNGTRRVRISFEYLLLSGLNDTQAHAEALARLLTTWTPHARLHSHVNLIPFNPWAGAPAAFSTPSHAHTARFQNVLQEAGLSTTLRTPRGSDVSGACGQLERAAKRERLLRAGQVRYS
jgi:23S rRNA (adenine2503-C2)-methyltransferase